MAFINAGYFAPQYDLEASQYTYCVPEALEPCVPAMSLEQAMYVWWKIYKVRYTYNWSYSGLQNTVVGSGSVVMDGGLQTMSQKVCPTTIYYSCSQQVTISNKFTGETSEVSDSVYLAIDSVVSKYNPEEGESLYTPTLTLTIVPGGGYSIWTAETCYAPESGGFVDFFGLGTLTIDNMILGYSVFISLSVEEESQPQ